MAEITSKFGYIYKVTNLINGKIYIGKKNGTAMDKTYYGSGVKIKKAIQEFGVDNFKVEILEWCSTKDILKAQEKVWIEKLHSQDPNIGYNTKIGGSESSKEKDYMNSKIIGVQLDKKLYNDLLQYASSIGGSLSSAIRFILINYLNTEQKGNK